MLEMAVSAAKVILQTTALISWQSVYLFILSRDMFDRKGILSEWPLAVSHKLHALHLQYGQYASCAGLQAE